MSFRPTSVRVGEPASPALCWQFDSPMLAISSSHVGGGVGLRGWVLNAQVPSEYARTDIDLHLGEMCAELGLRGDGVGLLTAAAVERFTSATDGGVEVHATVGLQHPTWAAAPAAVHEQRVGTINVVAFVPARLEPAAMVNAIVTATEAKAQALLEVGVPGTGTASDALCVLMPTDAPTEQFGGPRSSLGSRLARAVHHAVVQGIA